MYLHAQATNIKKGMKSKMRKHKKLNKLKISIIIFLIVIAITISAFGRYIYNGLRDAYLTAKQFYFTSDILKVNGAKYEYDNCGGLDVYPIEFELYSYINKLTKLDYDLNYKITCESLKPDKITCSVGTEDGGTSAEGTIYVSQNNTEKVTIFVKPIAPISQDETVKLKITATTEEPYKKSLSCEISLKTSSHNITFSIDDVKNRDYAILKLVNGNGTTTLTNLKFDPNKIRIDSNDEICQEMTVKNTTTIDGKEYITELEFNLPRESAKNIKFYKVDKSQNYVYPKGTSKNEIIVNGVNVIDSLENRMVVANSGSGTSNYLTSTIVREKIEKIEFELGKTEPPGIISSFDASEKQNKSIMGYYTDTDSNGLYELIFLSEESIAPNINGQYLFQSLTNVKEIIFNNFTTEGVTSMKYMFNNSRILTNLDLSTWDTSQVTDMSYMFSSCSGLTNLDVSKFDTSQVTNMQWMFASCRGLTELNISGFNTKKVTNMDWMFSSCGGLIKLNISGFDTSQVTNMNSMFYLCNRLTTIYVSEYDEVTGTGWTTSAVTNSNIMFGGCIKLVGQNGTTYNSAYEDATYARIDKPGNPGYFTSK